MKILKKLIAFFPLVVILFVYGISLLIVATRQHAFYGKDIKVIRIGHWQLEGGVRDGLNALAAEYEKLHPDVKIIQDAIPESTYSTWLSTQFMGGSTPDIVQMGMLPYQLTISYYNRYCYPLTDYVNKPNPYNRNNEFKDTPWRQTAKDGMRTGYVQELQEYMSVALSQASVRVFYNKEV